LYKKSTMSLSKNLKPFLKHSEGKGALDRQVSRGRMPKKKYRGTRTLKPKTKNQADYIRAMIESDITICDGPAGSGKTSVAVGLACQYLQEGKVDKIVVTRPVVESGKGLGYLPGNLHEKIHPYLIPVVEEMNLYLSREKSQGL